MHQHMPWTGQLESSFIENDLQILEEELNMSQKLASFSSFLPFFLGCFSFSLFSVLCIFYFFHYLVLIVLICVPHMQVLFRLTLPSGRL